jgi:hypothetical protein
MSSHEYVRAIRLCRGFSPLINMLLSMNPARLRLLLHLSIFEDVWQRLNDSQTGPLRPSAQISQRAYSCFHNSPPSKPRTRLRHRSRYSYPLFFWWIYPPYGPHYPNIPALDDIVFVVNATGRLMPRSCAVIDSLPADLRSTVT